MKDIVNALLWRNNKVLLARRSADRTIYPSCWSFPGGHVEPGESLGDALRREMQEEIGLTPLAFTEIGTIAEPNPQMNGEVVYHLFAVNAWVGGEPSILDNEHSEIQWFGIDTACTLEDLALAEYVPILRKLV